MKSVLLSFIMFAVVFTALSFDVQDIVDTKIFKYGSRISLVLVLLAGAYFVGIPGVSKNKNSGNKENSAANSPEFPQKTEDMKHEK